MMRMNCGGWRAAWVWVPLVLVACPGPGDLDPSAGNPVTAGGTSGATTTGSDESSSSTSIETDDSMSGSESGDPVEAVVDCGEFPPSAVEAELEHALLVTPSDLAWAWTVEGLPEGVSFNPISGLLTGTPLEAGTFTITASVEGASGSGSTECELVVAEALQFDFDALGKPCVGPDDNVLDFLTGGVGVAPTCSHTDGVGEGRIPNGVSVGEETCAIEGEPDDIYGAWVWITELEQSGRSVYVPYCVVEEDAPAGSYTIDGDHSGGTSNALEPAVQTFAPDAALDFGGDEDPVFRVLGPCGNTSCFFGFAFVVASSPFGNCGDDECFGLDPTSTLRDDTDSPIGFEHHLYARGDAPNEEFADRPFTLPWTIRYCIADVDGQCSGADDIAANGDGALHFSILMMPEP